MVTVARCKASANAAAWAPFKTWASSPTTGAAACTDDPPAWGTASPHSPSPDAANKIAATNHLRALIFIVLLLLLA